MEIERVSLHNQPASGLTKRRPKDWLKWAGLSVLCGLLAGVAASIFLYLLAWATETRTAHLSIIWALPLVGFLIGWLYHVYGKEVTPGNNLIIDEIHDPKKVLPLRMAPLILITTILTHLFGASAGREGTVVQMGAALSDQLAKFFSIEAHERRVLLVCGAGAGFGAAIGAPWAGVIFGMEAIYVGRLSLFALAECLIASFVAYFTTLLLRAPHSHYATFPIPEISLKLLLFVVLAGAIYGIFARGFIKVTHVIEKIQARFISYAPLRPFVGGLILLFFYSIEGSYRYLGLGIPVIQQSLLEPAPLRDPFLKAIFTAITLGSGFKGGEFIPLVFIGTTLGSSLAPHFYLSLPLFAALGFAAVFAGAANTPIACSLMAAELFGWSLLPLALLACFVSYLFSGQRGIYRTQKVFRKKPF